jgi:hypothetical protein
MHCLVPVSSAGLQSAGGAYVGDSVTVGEGQRLVLICTTSSSRPAANIQWFVGTSDVTQHADMTQFGEATPDGLVAVRSTLQRYVSSMADYQMQAYCNATNIAGYAPIKSKPVSIYVGGKLYHILSLRIKTYVFTREAITWTYSAYTRIDCRRSVYMWGGLLLLKMSIK